MPASLKPLPLNQFSDLIRREIAVCGYMEVLTWILCSYKENFAMLKRKDDKSTAVVVRSSLMAGILKTAAHNKDHPKPIKIFEVGDVTVFDELKDVGSTNHRQLAALYCGATSGFEVKLCFLNIIFPNMKI
ncbi:putative phenylalanine--tRNA ligase [Helianthus annuus]|nr:putative phenylalanine--tRNA ligase [Helianthus annuus]